jgi:hypothetical protein
VSGQLPTTGALAGFRPWTPAEDEAVRSRYSRGNAARLARELDRSVVAVRKRAARLGLNVARRWTAADDAKLADLWSEAPVSRIAKLLGRTPLTTYWRARQLGLPCGAPRGLEYLTDAADRTGYGTGQLRIILRAGGVKLQLSASRPTKARRHYHVVDPDDVDRAVATWLESEVVNCAAEVRGLSGETLRRWLLEAQANGFEVPAEPEEKKARWRVPSKTIDAVVSWHRSFESLTEASLRVGVGRGTLSRWLTDAGVERTKTKPWFVAKPVVDRVVAERLPSARKAGRRAA